MCMQCAASQLCLDKDYSLRIALPFVCCCVSVLYRHHGLGLSSTRYSKCMAFSYTRPSFMSRKSNSILDGCRSKFLIKWGSGKSIKTQRPNRPVQVCPSLSLFGFHINLTSSSLLQNFNLAGKSISQYKTCACSHMIFLMTFCWWFIDFMLISSSTCFLSKNWFCWGKTLLRSLVSSHPHLQISFSPLPILDYNFCVYSLH